jgi:hypothetical protein
MSFEKDEIVLKSVDCSVTPQTPKTNGHFENSNPSSSYWKSYFGELRLCTEPVDKSVVYVPRN